jgi:hypothetical protein
MMPIFFIALILLSGRYWDNLSGSGFNPPPADCRPPINAHPPECVADSAFIGLRLAPEPDLKF